MRVSDFDYDLPGELIAQRPMEPRDASRLMVLHRQDQTIEHRHFCDLPEFLRPEDVLVINDTRVIPARLFGEKAETGGKVEFLLLKREALNTWEVLVKPGRRVRPGHRVVFGRGVLAADVLAATASGGRLVRFHFEGSFESVLDQLGEMPLPPYIRAQLDEPERYQTVYARDPGSAAAPTAGLHFTRSLLDCIGSKGVAIVAITLHVGLGTFRPVAAETVEAHEMHSEFYRVDQETAATINRRRTAGGRIVAVGTTASRTLETVTDRDGLVTPGSGWTDIFIYPGYEFHAVDALITNFHLPKSTLMMLVSALAGRDFVLESYGAAVENRYRFFSFGDAMLIL